MPIVHVHLAAGRPVAQKKAILDGLHSALVDAFRIPEHDRNQLIHEYAPGDLEARHGADAVLVELSVFPGRSLDAKRRLYEGIVRNLERAAGIDPQRVLIVLHEPPLENWGIRGGKPATDVQLGFKLDV